ncbi:LamG domain-containing protein [Lutibacter sp. Hel_I_33_5]|uniref:LamG domain-containing protein n=1 Tax=Lutibacter sp. Hel_I_33_5 TaxID=1566289 RepID=UPI0011A347E3|nr:LamG domain-containing protein [Lutibacter sp. Hel_I_33_5]
MKLRVITLLTALFYSSILLSQSPGSGATLDFDGTNDYIDLGASGIALSTTFTLEAWIYSSQVNGSWHGFIGNQSSGGANRAPGMWVYQNNRIHFGFGNGTTWQSGNTPSNSFIENQWNHVAMTYEGTNLRVYINGVLVTTRTGTTGTPVDPLRWIGRVDNYFDGKIDEVRVWTTARSETELRTNMCQKLTGSETGLAGYWRFDEASGTTLTAVTGPDGTLTNMNAATDWETSGAAIGNASSYTYGGSSVSLTSTNRGDFEVNTITGTPDGVHIYRVDTTPNSETGITNTIGSNDIYYGVYVAGGTSPTYTGVYDYTSYVAAQLAEPNIEGYNRTDNSYTTWASISPTVDTAANTYTETGNSGINQEFLIGGLNIVSTDVVGYLGPGGVGQTDGSSALKFWILPENGVTKDGSDNLTAWSDQSGYGSNVSTIGGDPNVSATINSYDVVNFDGNDHLVANITSNTSNQLSAYVAADITNYTSTTWTGILSASTSGQLDWNNNNRTVLLNRLNNTNDLHSYRNGTKSIVTNGLSVSGFKIMNSEYDGANNIIRQNGIAGSTVSSTGNFNFSLLSIAKRYTENKYTSGNYAEVFYYDKPLNLAQKIIVENYLQAKYNSTLDANDFYNEDDNGNYDFDVAGIGQASDGSRHDDSQGTGIVRINNPSGMTDDEFLFWGRNNRDALSFTTNTANYKERLNTRWRVSRRNNPGNVTVTFDLNSVDLSGKSDCSTIQLVIDNNDNLLSPSHVYDLTHIGGNFYRAENVTFVNNRKFSLEFIDKIVVDDTQFYNGSGDSNVPDTNDDCFKLLVKNTADGSLAITENGDVREVEVESGGKLVLNTNTRLQITNGIVNEGDIRLTGSSQLIQTHTGGSMNSGAGNLYIDQNSDLASVYRYNYWSSPVLSGASNYTVPGVLKNGTTPTSDVSNPPDLAFTTGYDGSTGPLTLSSYWIYDYLNGTDGSSWVQKGELGTFNPGEGFLLKSPGATQNYTFKGVPNDGDYSFGIDADKTSLLGNPYPSALDANQLFIDSSNLATLYFWEHKNEVTGSGEEGHWQSGYIGGYSYRNATMGTAADTAVSGTAGLGGETYTAPLEDIFQLVKVSLQKQLQV